MSNVVERFVRYAKIDTQSDSRSKTSPSTEKQLDLARMLRDELSSLGLQDVNLDEVGCVTATLPTNMDKPVPVLGLLAHMDTAPDISGKDVSPQFVEHYDGADIMLNKEQNIILSPREFPELAKYVGKTLITTDGTTLLGADDKAGIAEIMTAVEYLVQNPQIPHGTLRIGFTPDEEIGRGGDALDVEKFNADFAYTLDSGEVGEINFENFNAAGAKVIVKGRGVHPGGAKNKMINASNVAIELHNMLPAVERPEYTEGYEGFTHLTGMQGDVEQAVMQYIIRDHDREKFEARKKLLQQTAEILNARYGEGSVVVEIRDQYFNMKEKIEPVMHLIETAKQAIMDAGVVPHVSPVRGGTDGARFSFRGLPTPNLFTGGHNFHGRYEYIPTFAMEKAVEVILNIVRAYAN